MPRGRPLRLFVALYPPPSIAADLLALLPALNLPPHRAVPAEQVHLTLLFIGDTDPRDLRAVTESVDRSAAGLEPFHLTPTRLFTIPDRPPTAPPRLLAAETDAPPALLELQRRLSTRLARAKRPGKPDKFLPHLTLCRFPEATPRPAAVNWCAPIPGEATMFHVEHATLVASELTPSGAHHRPVHTAPLG